MFFFQKVTISIHIFFYFFISLDIIYSQFHCNGVRRCQNVSGGGGGGGGRTQTHVIYVPSVKNQYCIWIYGYLLTAICVSLLKLSVLYKRIIQVENKNVRLKVGGTNMPLPPPPPTPNTKVGGRTCPPCTHTHAHTHPSYASAL